MYVESDGGFSIEKYNTAYPLKEYDYQIYELIRIMKLIQIRLIISIMMSIGYLSNLKKDRLLQLTTSFMQTGHSTEAFTSLNINSIEKSLCSHNEQRDF